MKYVLGSMHWFAGFYDHSDGMHLGATCTASMYFFIIRAITETQGHVKMWITSDKCQSHAQSSSNTKIALLRRTQTRQKCISSVCSLLCSLTLTRAYRSDVQHVDRTCHRQMLTERVKLSRLCFVDWCEVTPLADVHTT